MSEERSVWTPQSLLEWTAEFFGGKGVPTPRLDAELLLAHVLATPRINLYLQFDRPLTKDELARYRALVRRRGEREPVAYLTGQVGFWNLTLRVRKGILIPSPDSETLVETILGAIGALRQGKADKPLTVLELGTGSACLPLATCSETQHLRWIAVERSAEALALARENRADHEALLEPRSNALHLVRGDRFEALSAKLRPDLVVGNPPYIPSGTIARLMPEVSRAEPRMALDGGADGLDFHRYMIAYAAQALAPKGRLIMEMGAEQERALRAAVADRHSLTLRDVPRDMSGQPRVIHAERTGA